MSSLDLSHNPHTYSELKRVYSEPHRHYHTLQHIESCLKHLDRVKSLAIQPDEIAIALWFHDAVYSPYGSDNETRSANWATDFLEENSVSPDRTARVRGLVMSTLHTASAMTEDEALMVDIDLSILGVSADDYQEFEKTIREEYKRIPKPLYRLKRKKVLRGFLDRGQIYQTQHFYDMLEAQARENLSNVLAS